MLFTHDILTLTILCIVLLFACCKGSGKKSHEYKNTEKEFYKWLAEGCDRRNHDKNHSNTRWVEEHFKD